MKLTIKSFLIFFLMALDIVISRQITDRNEQIAHQLFEYDKQKHKQKNHIDEGQHPNYHPNIKWDQQKGKFIIGNQHYVYQKVVFMNPKINIYSIGLIEEKFKKNMCQQPDIIRLKILIKTVKRKNKQNPYLSVINLVKTQKNQTYQISVYQSVRGHLFFIYKIQKKDTQAQKNKEKAINITVQSKTIQAQKTKQQVLPVNTTTNSQILSNKQNSPLDKAKQSIQQQPKQMNIPKISPYDKKKETTSKSNQQALKPPYSQTQNAQTIIQIPSILEVQKPNLQTQQKPLITILPDQQTPAQTPGSTFIKQCLIQLIQYLATLFEKISQYWTHNTIKSPK